jgi:hypothetical protein
MHIAVFPVFLLSTYEFCLSLWKIARCSVILLLPLSTRPRVVHQDRLNPYQENNMGHYQTTLPFLLLHN